ncbi:MAG TPA: hypothetical protein VFW87_03040 [Pirellulales bacterium]|nr:hypothetical protein [Pirellulales bacterium]
MATIKNEVSVEVLSDSVNYMVLSTPGRQFPGMVVQGDSLARLYRCAAEVCRRAKGSEDQELIDEAGILCEELRDRLAFYEKVLKSHGIKLPYSSPTAREVAP